LAWAFEQQGRLDDAERLCRETLTLRREILPSKHENIGRSLIVLGRILTQKGKTDEAERCLREASALFRERYPEKIDLIAEAENWLGVCLTTRGDYEEAERLLLRSYETLESSLAVPARQKQKALDNVINLYLTWKKPEKAEAWKAKRQTLD
jgi:tetratricopeptide (TPR) repeat protein